MKLAAYCRVSSSEQAQENTIELQREQIAAWAEREGHVIESWHEDVGISGSVGIDLSDPDKIGTRKGLAMAIGAVPDVEGIIVYNLSRLARDLILQEQLLADIRKAGGVLMSTIDVENANLVGDPADPYQKFIRQMFGAVAEFERGLIRLRLNAGIERKRRAGGFCGGAIPFGYTVRDDVLVEDPKEQEAIAMARRLHAEGGKSLRAIGAELAAAGHSPRGKAFHPELVKRIIER